MMQKSPCQKFLLHLAERKTCGHLKEIGTNTQYRSRLGDCYYIINDVTVMRISFCLHTFRIIREHVMGFSQNACIFNFHYTVQGSLPPPQAPPALLFKMKFLFRHLKFDSANQCVPRRHKSKHWSEWASSEKSWYVLEYKAPLISTGTNFLQPSQKGQSKHDRTDGSVNTDRTAIERANGTDGTANTGVN